MRILSAMTLGEKIRKRRKELGLSQPKLAKATKGLVLQSRISEVENGEGSFSAEQIAALAEALMVPADWLLSQEEDEPAYAPNTDKMIEIWKMVRRIGEDEALERLDLKPEGKRRQRGTDSAGNH